MTVRGQAVSPIYRKRIQEIMKKGFEKIANINAEILNVKASQFKNMFNSLQYSAKTLIFLGRKKGTSKNTHNKNVKIFSNTIHHSQLV